MKLSQTTKLLLKVVLVIYACLVVVWLYSAMRHYGKREVEAITVEEELRLAKDFELKDGRLLDRGQLIDQRIKQALVADGIEEVEVLGRGDILKLNLNFFCTLGFQILNFGILLILLLGVLWQPLLKVLDDRAARIRRDLEAAQSSRTQAEKVLADRNQLLGRARQLRSSIIEDGQRAAHQEREKIVEAAQREARLIVEKAQAQVQADFESARQALQQETASLSVALATKILQREISRDDHAKLIDDFIAQLAQQRA